MRWGFQFPDCTTRPDPIKRTEIINFSESQNGRLSIRLPHGRRVQDISRREKVFRKRPPFLLTWRKNRRCWRQRYR